MSVMRSIGKFFADILKDILGKVISFLLLITFVFLVVRYVFGISLLRMFFG